MVPNEDTLPVTIYYWKVKKMPNGQIGPHIAIDIPADEKNQGVYVSQYYPNDLSDHVRSFTSEEGKRETAT